MSNSNHSLVFMFLLILPYTISALSGGSWEPLLENVGISAMHMQLLDDDRVVMFDRTNFGASQLPLPADKCRKNPKDRYLSIDCTAHSAEYNVKNNSIRPLNVFSDTWCSSGAVLGDGRLAQTGGSYEGERVARIIESCSDCDWVEFPNGIISHRWYASNHILPNGASIIVGGRQANNFEFFPKTPTTNTLLPFPFLGQVNNPGIENNLYPFLFLAPDGNFFCFANNRAVLFDYKTNVVLREYPVVPGGDPRNYPSTGSAVLLPLRDVELGDKVEAEVIVCGGAPQGSYAKSLKKVFVPALNSCARIKFTDPNATWVMENMPMARTMSDMLLLPNEDVLIINGAGSGAAGWDGAINPVLSPVIYHPSNVIGSRFEVMSPATTPRMYHSCAVLLRDGRVLAGGSNPHEFYNFTGVQFPTELSLDAYKPPYLDPILSKIRPVITSPASRSQIGYGAVIRIGFSITGSINPGAVKVTMIRPPFNTHSFSMSQRMLVLTTKNVLMGSSTGQFTVVATTPGSANIGPPGYYMLFVVHKNVPSEAIWVKLAQL